MTKFTRESGAADALMDKVYELKHHLAELKNSAEETFTVYRSSSATGVGDEEIDHVHLQQATALSKPIEKHPNHSKLAAAANEELLAVASYVRVSVDCLSWRFPFTTHSILKEGCHARCVLLEYVLPWTQSSYLKQPHKVVAVAKQIAPETVFFTHRWVQQLDMTLELYNLWKNSRLDLVVSHKSHTSNMKQCIGTASAQLQELIWLPFCIGECELPVKNANGQVLGLLKFTMCLGSKSTWFSEALSKFTISSDTTAKESSPESVSTFEPSDPHHRIGPKSIPRVVDAASSVPDSHRTEEQVRENTGSHFNHLSPVAANTSDEVPERFRESEVIFREQLKSSRTTDVGVQTDLSMLINAAYIVTVARRTADVSVQTLVAPAIPVQQRSSMTQTITSDIDTFTIHLDVGVQMPDNTAISEDHSRPEHHNTHDIDIFVGPKKRSTIAERLLSSSNDVFVPTVELDTDRRKPFVQHHQEGLCTEKLTLAVNTLHNIFLSDTHDKFLITVVDGSGKMSTSPIIFYSGLTGQCDIPLNWVAELTPVTHHNAVFKFYAIDAVEHHQLIALANIFLPSLLIVNKCTELSFTGDVARGRSQCDVLDFQTMCFSANLSFEITCPKSFLKLPYFVS